MLLISLLSGCSSSTGDSGEDITPPAVPSGLKITEIGNGAASLSWNPVSDSGLKEYIVYWIAGEDIDTLRADRDSTTNNYITIVDLDYDRIYSFSVSSLDKSGNESALSALESGMPSKTTFPDPPSGLDIVAVNIDSSLITVYWDKNEEPDFEYYKLFRALSAVELEDSTSFVTTLTDEIYYDVDVDVGITYYYRLTAVDKGDWESAPSEPVYDLVLPAVTLLSPVNRESTGTTPTFQWESVEGAVQYKLFVLTDYIGGEIWNTEVEANKNEWEKTVNINYNGNTKLKAGETYYWVVGAISKKEINSKSNIEAFRVQ
jgi:fibronectin type 3 domain-containing protein